MPGWATIHAHRLRHTAATTMLRAGSPLAEVGQVLRHRARVDHRDLRQGRPGRARGAGAALAESSAHDGRRVVTGPLRDALADYLALRRALGYRLARPEKLLGQFLDYLEARRRRRGSPSRAALDWARLPASGESNWWAYRLSVVRGFATYLHALDPAHEVPAADLLPQRPQRASPYLYSDAEIAALIAAAGVAAHPAAAGHVRHADRAAGGHRDAGR